MRTIDQILIHARPDDIYRAAADIERWPDILPHYRWVREISRKNGSRTVEMAARRGLIPVKWTSIQRLDPVYRRVYYRHIAGATRGMEVEWSVEPQGDSTLVRIVHDLTLTNPIINSPPGKWVVASFFIKSIAGRTLTHLKLFLELERMDGCGEQ